MRFVSLACVGLSLALSGCAAHRAAAPAAAAPVVLTAQIREAVANDYLRISFLPAGVQVTSISRPGSLRGFATAIAIYIPPLKLAEFPFYSGLANDDSKTLVAMRCRPPHPETVDAVLATWPNVFLAIQRDVPLNPGACDGEPSDPATRTACVARAFSDPAGTAVPPSLARTFTYAGTLYDGAHAALAQWLQNNYGIYPAFSGTGYSVKDSYSLSTQPMTSQQVLAKSISSEYLLKNVSLAEGGCRCISVARYDGRADDPLDPDFIWQTGGDGVCRSVPRLSSNHRRR